MSAPPGQPDAHRVLVMGAGAIGCWAGGLLARIGARPLLVGRAAVIEPLRARGLWVGDLDGLHEHVAPGRFDAVDSVDTAARLLAARTAAEGPTEATVLLCVKGGATREAAGQLRRALPAGTPVVSLQNGIDNVARIRDAAPELVAIAGMVPFNVAMREPGVVYRATAGGLHLQDAPATRRLLPLLRVAGMVAHVHADLAGLQWGKLLLNLNNPVNALSDLPLREQLLDRHLRAALALLQAEALRALRAAHIVPATVAAVPPAWLVPILRLPTPLFRLVAARMLRIDPVARSSMWDDVQAGRPTEIDDFCGAVVRLGRAHGVPAPANERMVELVRHHARGRTWDGAELLAALRAPTAAKD